MCVCACQLVCVLCVFVYGAFGCDLSVCGEFVCLGRVSALHDVYVRGIHVRDVSGFCIVWLNNVCTHRNEPTTFNVQNIPLEFCCEQIHACVVFLCILSRACLKYVRCWCICKHTCTCETQLFIVG